MAEQRLRVLVDMCNNTAADVASKYRPAADSPPLKLLVHQGHHCVLMTLVRGVDLAHSVLPDNIRAHLKAIKKQPQYPVEKAKWKSVLKLHKRAKRARRYLEKRFGVAADSIFHVFGIHAFDLKHVKSRAQRKFLPYIPQCTTGKYAYFFVPVVLLGAMIAMDEGDDASTLRLIWSRTLTKWAPLYRTLCSTLGQMIQGALDAERQMHLLAKVDDDDDDNASAGFEVAESSNSDSLDFAPPVLFSPLFERQRGMLGDAGVFFPWETAAATASLADDPFLRVRVEDALFF